MIISPLSIGTRNHLTHLLGEEVLPWWSLQNRIIVANIGSCPTHSVGFHCSNDVVQNLATTLEEVILI